MKKLMAANWKMFKTYAEACGTAREIVAGVGTVPDDREVLIIPPFTALKGVGEVMAGAGDFFLGAQNFYPAEQGAFTGEISADQITDVGAKFVLVGHSERRHVLGEKDEFLNSKVLYALQAGLKVILCIGETLKQRKSGLVHEILGSQLENGLSGVSRDIAADNLVVAYEPVWAIGTGEVAQNKDISQAHGFVREKMNELLQNSNEIRVLYGGSVKPENCKEIISLDNVDGVLVGGASLRGDSFTQIVLA